MSEDHHRFIGRLSLENGMGGGALSDKRIRLLELIDELGSINQAAKAVPLSYKAAWDAIDAMNNMSAQPLVTRVSGGRQGGGTQLTDYGRRLVAMYRALELEYQHVLDQVAERMTDLKTADIREFQFLMRRLSLKTSARNQFSGPICGLRDGGVDYEVRVRLDDQTEILAVITKASAETLQLAIGKDVMAFVKSSSVLLSTEQNLHLTARNQLWGEVTEIHQGVVNDEITLQISSGRTVTAVISHESCVEMGLAVGKPACALFKASSVILASYD